jgi:hypothetical protein
MKGSESIAPQLLNAAQDGGQWSASRLAALPRGNNPLVRIVWEAGWGPEPV